VVAVPPPAPPPLVSLPAPPPAARPATSRPPPSGAPQPAAAVESTSAAGRVLKLQELPDTLRRQIPPMAFGGATDSPERSARMLIINGQIWREGDELSPGLKLERIALRGAIFRFREQRFELSY
jgi:general secretion pathway protein B